MMASTTKLKNENRFMLGSAFFILKTIMNNAKESPAKNANVNRLARASGRCYNVVYWCVVDLEKKGLLTRAPFGEVKLTRKGESAAKNIFELEEMI